MDTDTFTINYPCQYCKQMTRQLINKRGVGGQTWSQGRRLSVCSECGYLSSISDDEVEKCGSTKQQVNIFEVSAVYKKWDKLKESNEYKLWREKVSEEAKEVARNFISAGESPKQATPFVQIPRGNERRGFLSEFAAYMGYNLLWYVPVCLWILIDFIIPNITSGFTNTVIVLRHFTWGLLLSSSAGLFFVAIGSSITMPIFLLGFLPAFFKKGGPFDYKKRYLYTILLLFVIIVGSILLQLVIMGSYPIVVDKNDF
ncbi:MAG: hypothetical protein M1511_12695 [Deltaproteobacteria bacterium]|nr:hypothetical protein [Deltaproteobacteria bacterium]